MTLVAQTVRHSGKSEKDRLVEAEAILSDKINGMPVSQIMEKYGLSSGTVYNRINAAVDARIAPTVDRYREMMNAAYDEQLVRANQNVNGALVLVDMASKGDDPAVVEKALAAHLRALEMVNRIREAQRKLNGLDSPVKVDMSVTVTTPLDTAIADLVSQLDSAPATP